MSRLLVMLASLVRARVCVHKTRCFVSCCFSCISSSSRSSSSNSRSSSSNSSSSSSSISSEPNLVCCSITCARTQFYSRVKIKEAAAILESARACVRLQVQAGNNELARARSAANYLSCNKHARARTRTNTHTRTQSRHRRGIFVIVYKFIVTNNHHVAASL